MLKRLKLSGLAVAALALAGLCAAPACAAPRKPIEVRVVVVTTWEATKDGKDLFGELHAWLTRFPLSQEIAFPAGDAPLHYDPGRHVLAILTGEATARAAASITALGHDPRFDLRHAYWVVAGTAGVDPKIASVGSAAWARYVVDGDLAQEIDAREIPADWPTGILPNDRTKPFEQPAPPAFSNAGNVAFSLNRKLADWAYARTKDLKIPDYPAMADLRAPYSGPGAKPPFVLEGDGLMAARFWYGEKMNAWAEAWVPYWTGGQGVFAMSAEEDTGILQALTFLSQAGKADLSRVLVLRAASDYAVAPPGMTTPDFLAKEQATNFPGTPGALESLYVTASPVVKALADDWAHTRGSVPGG